MKKSDHHVLNHITAALFWHINSIWEKTKKDVVMQNNRDKKLFSDFIHLVNIYACKHHNITFFADKLLLSPRYMSKLIKYVSNKSAKEWIDEAIITAIKIELKHTNKPLKQISDEMNFTNISFLCKYFKRMTGYSPTEYRNQK